MSETTFSLNLGSSSPPPSARRKLKDALPRRKLQTLEELYAQLQAALAAVKQGVLVLMPPGVQEDDVRVTATEQTLDVGVRTNPNDATGDSVRASVEDPAFAVSLSLAAGTDVSLAQGQAVQTSTFLISAPSAPPAARSASVSRLFKSAAPLAAAATAPTPPNCPPPPSTCVNFTHVPNVDNCTNSIGVTGTATAVGDTTSRGLLLDL